ncbi:hypothetical protein ACLSU7_03075 [Bdellovibrio sp. HCB185ZH]|uniref:hypothetical protein n=1 Tax=Bdellovibrio sp. HCB185ZH TaxID=3394235 RepID=UPI0039A65A54
MKEKKLNHAIKCLLAAAGIQILTLAYSVVMILDARAQILDMISKDPTLYATVKVPSIFDASALMAALIVVAVYFVIHDLRKGKGWAWVGGITVFALSLMTFAFPVAIYGLICLLDERVRTEYIAELDVAI